MNTAVAGRPKTDVDQLLIKHSSALFEHLENRVELVELAVENTLKLYFDDRNRLSRAFAEGIQDKYWHSGLFFRVVRRTLYRKPYAVYDLYWGKGKSTTNATRYKSPKLKARITETVHRCETERGEYSLNNLRMACVGKAEFEHQLAFEYEKVLRPLREDLRGLSSLVRTIVDYGSLPDIDDALEAIPDLGVTKSIEKWKKRR